MPRTCTVCQHRSRRKIDFAIATDQSNRSIEAQYRVTASSVQRHKTHVAKAVQRARAQRELSIGEDVVSRLETLYQRGMTILKKSEKRRNFSASVGCMRELRGLLHSIYMLTKEAIPQQSLTSMTDEMQEQYVRAINFALGVGHPFVPLKDGEPTKPGGGESSDGAKATWPPKLLPETTDGSADLKPEDRILDDGLPVLP
jgi:hypothetical protein